MNNQLNKEIDELYKKLNISNNTLITGYAMSNMLCNTLHSDMTIKSNSSVLPQENTKQH